MTTAAEQTAWQARAVTVLTDLLIQAARDGLPVLCWTVSNTGAALSGRSLAVPSSRRRADLQAWGDALGIDLHYRPWQDGGGQITGAGRRGIRHGPCEIRLVADWYADDDGEDPPR